MFHGLKYVFEIPFTLPQTDLTPLIRVGAVISYKIVNLTP